MKRQPLPSRAGARRRLILGASGLPIQGSRRNSWGRRVLRLGEAFLLQMNDFDKFLDLQLRHMLDPVVATPAPPRRTRRPRARQRILAIEAASIETGAFAPQTIPVVEPVVTAVPVASSQL